MGNKISAHQRAAALLDGHSGYKVLRALPAPGVYSVAEPQGLVRTAAVIDVETMGPDPNHPIIDLPIQRVAFDTRGVIVQVGQPRQWFEDPGMSIPADITRLTGITDADVAGKRIDTDEAVSLITSTTVAIAHNAAFDAPRVERRLPAIAGHAWACSCNEVPWPELGFDGRKLGHLLMQQGIFHHGHRAAVDVWATINLLGSMLPDGETVSAKLIRQAEQPSVRMEATNAPFEAKDALKARGYRWHADRRTWWTEIATADEAAETGWLREACSCTQPKLTPVTWVHRHRG